MRLKLDENLGLHHADLLRAGGCRPGARHPDLDFAHPRRFPPGDTQVSPCSVSNPDPVALNSTRLWVVDGSLVRQYEPPSDGLG